MLNKQSLICKLKEYCSFVVGQEEISDNGFCHIEIFLTTKNNYTYNSIRKNLNVPFIKPVESVDVLREIEYCVKLFMF